MADNLIGLFSPLVQRSLGPDVGGGPLLIDAVVEENIRLDASVTDSPIEVASGDGVVNASVSDHVYLEPNQYTMRGVISDFPITWAARRDAFAESSNRTRSVSALQLLMRHFKRRLAFDVQTDLVLLKNMVFVSLQIPRNSRNSRSLEFMAELREVQIVVPKALSREKSEADVAGDDQAETQAVSEVDRGQASAPTVEQSLGAQAVDSVSSLFGG